MQSTDSPTPTESEWWWPSPGSFDDLSVTDTDDGWELSAPDGTELAAWLSYWTETKERHDLFQSVFVRTLEAHALTVINDITEHGQDENLPDRGNADREQAEAHSPGSLS